MDTMNIDFSVLMDDFERVVAMERLGYGPDDPTVRSICRRYCIAQEDILDKTVEISGAVLDKVTNSGVKLSAKLVEKMFEWFNGKRQDVMRKLSEQFSVAKGLQNDIVKLEPKVRLKNTFTEREIDTGKWLYNLCVDGEYDLHQCIEYADKDKVLNEITKSYTVHAAALFRDPKRKVIEGNEIHLTKINRSTASAIKRAAPVLGLGAINPGRGVEAFPLPGNVIITLDSTFRGIEVVDFAVIRSGDLPEKIKTVSKHDMESALKAAYSLTEQLIERNTSRKVFSYGGVYDALEDLKKEIESGHMEDSEIKAAKIRLSNAINIEDAITTSMVRVCQGLVEITKRSL